ncbi:MAG TPA: hypothetical protein VKX45_03465 [Bryobacteraceae bacterium]|jgi:hypothetical protein|nr:hypothetical protein [Bryobacteraceae bacterium]
MTNVATGAEIKLLPEPELEFRYGQRTHDPHAGLALFGPHSAGTGTHPRSIVYGVIGAPEGADAFQQWSRRMQDAIVEPLLPKRKMGRTIPPDDRKLYLLWPPFPGFEGAFASEWPVPGGWRHELDRDKLLALARQKDPNTRAYDVVSTYCDAISLIKKRDEAFHVLVCVIPEEVYQNCRPQSHVKATGSGTEKPPSLEALSLSVDFRRQLKARAMEFGVPVQIVRETTLRIGPPRKGNNRGLTAESDRAWNLGNTLYYKAGGKPWRLSTARKGVCYIGLAFRRAGGADRRTACCAAQMFLDTGDGIVFKGEFGPWFSPEEKQCHLDRQSARNLLTGALATYSEQGGEKLTEIFLHSRSTINADEFAGYQDACPAGVKLVAVRVRSDFSTKMFRAGEWPVVRGTFWKLSDRSAYLWASGFKPSLLTYDGWEVPTPLRIDIEHGEADIEQVAADIFGLTKLNYNTCKLGDSLPVTVGFSDAVGEILIANPTVKATSPSFKFYI